MVSAASVWASRWESRLTPGLRPIRLVADWPVAPLRADAWTTWEESETVLIRSLLTPEVSAPPTATAMVARPARTGPDGMPLNSGPRRPVCRAARRLPGADAVATLAGGGLTAADAAGAGVVTGVRAAGGSARATGTVSTTRTGVGMTSTEVAVTVVRGSSTVGRATRLPT